MAESSAPIPIYGLLAEFAGEEALLHAARQVRGAGYQRVEAYTPFPVEGLAEALGIRGRRLPLIVLAGGIVGGAGALLMQWYSAVMDYPLNVGGRPYASWPSFVPVAFELTILVAGFAAVLGMFALNGLPQPYHPLFNAPEFTGASRDSFFLCVEAADPKFDVQQVRALLQELGALRVIEVEP
ncbi:MAG TPA: DUF3341 domain-containing protein [Caldilineaceae bacterium]|nr:DUF3341 domain-containing protein [Caldilineaceae bacterium]